MTRRYKHPRFLVVLLASAVVALAAWGLARLRSGSPATPSPDDMLRRHDFDWHTHETPHFLIHCETGSFAQKKMEYLTTVQESAMPRVLDLLGEQAYPRKVHLFAVESRARMKTLIGFETNGKAFPQSDTVLSVFSQRLQAVSAHELMHVLVFHCWGEMKQDRMWLSEGLAVYADNGWSGYDLHALAGNLRQSGKLLPLQELLSNFRTHSDMITYPESGSLVKFLYEQYGREKVKQLWQLDHADMQQIFGKSPAELEAEWLRFINEAPSPNIKYNVGSQ